jgi:hypothetical protein
MGFVDVQATSAALKAPITADSNAWLPLIAIGPSRRSSASHHASGVAWPTGRRTLRLALCSGSPASLEPACC